LCYVIAITLLSVVTMCCLYYALST